MDAVHFDPVTLWVRDFERCLAFYRDVFELEVLRLYRGEDHPPWAEFRMGDTRFCLHGGYGDGARYRTGQPLALHFEVADVEAALDRIRRHGGEVRATSSKKTTVQPSFGRCARPSSATRTATSSRSCSS